MVRRFLITTALEETWRSDGPVLFLGEWCKRYSRRAHWSALDAQVLPYHWDDRAKLERDYHYLQQVNEKALRSLTALMNEHHGVAHSERYWRLLVGPWLGYFIQILFDRWQSIQQALATYDIGETLVLDLNPDTVVPPGMADFAPLFVSDRWNHWIYSQILEHRTAVRVVKVNPMAPRGAAPDAATLPRRESLSARARGMVKRLLSTASATLARSDFFFINSCIDQQWRLEKALGQLPTFWAAPSSRHMPLNWEQRRQLTLSFDAGNEFETFLAFMIPRQIPALYLEGYASMVKQTETISWPRQPKVIFTASAHNTNDFFKTWAAGKVEAGAKLVIGQHGGHFGIGRWVFHEDHEYAVADSYFSWGWTNPRNTKVRPLPSQKLGSLAKNLKHDPQGGVLLVLASLPRYSYWMYSIPVASQMVDYLDEQMRFAETLRGNAKNQLLVRFYPHDYGWDQKLRWRDRLPNAQFDEPGRSMYESARKCRLFVATYNATTFLETLAADFPTVMFWNPNHWEIRDEAAADFDRLREVGILHDTPESAAQKVNDIWDDVDGWWDRADIRRTRAVICNKYARTSPQWLPEWTAALHDVARSGTTHEMETIDRPSQC